MASLLATLVERTAGWRLISSPLGRARDTAAVVADALGLAVEFDERLVEIGCGAWEQRLRDELAAEDPNIFADREWFFRSPGGETYEDVWARVSGWLAEQAPEPARRLIVVSHGVAGRLLRGAYAGLSREQTLAQEVPQDAVFRLVGASIERIDCPACGDR